MDIPQVSNAKGFEENWAALAAVHAERHFTVLTDQSRPRPSAAPRDDEQFGTQRAHALFVAFRTFLPDFNVRQLDCNSPLAGYHKSTSWPCLVRRHGHLVTDPHIGALLRVNAAQPPAPGNLVFVSRLQWAMVEAARDREGANDAAWAQARWCVQPTKRFSVFALRCEDAEPPAAEVRRLAEAEMARGDAIAKEQAAAVVEQRNTRRGADAWVDPRAQALVAANLATLTRELASCGVAVLDHALDAASVHALRAEALELQLRNTPQLRDGVRDDKIAWLAAPDECAAEGLPALANAARLLFGFAHALQGVVADDLPLAPPRHVMLAAYRGGSASLGYVPHRDNVPTARLQEEGVGVENDRELTVVLYANERDWSGEIDGGCLRCYTGARETDDEGEDAAFRDVAPEAGRLVLFRSRKLLHRVMPVLAEGKVRVALSVWLLKA
jgi:hypothetical protein